MIRYYAYYNHGGYKDFYVGNTKEEVTSKYFLPLLAVHEQSLEENPNDEALKEQIEHQRRLPKLVALSDATPDYNYPKEARVLMSHGGYKILYKRLDYKNYALAIRDIPGPKDVYGRQSPFNMMFIGDEDDLVSLDKLAEHIRNNYCQFLDFLGTLFINDLNENGLRCDNDRLTSLLHSIIECDEAISLCVSNPLHVRMLVVGYPCDLKTTFKEQNITKREVNVCFDETGNQLFKAIEEQPNARTNASSMNVEQEIPHKRQEATDRKTILSLHAMTNTPKIEDIEKIWDYIRGMERRTVQMSKHIEELKKKLLNLKTNEIMNKKKTLFGLDSKSYEHDFDKTALKTLKALPGFDKVVNFFLNWTYIKWHIVELQGSNFLVTRESCPELYDLVHDVADTLDVRPLPRFYTQWGYNINGYTTGYKEDTILVLNSGTIDLLSEDELRYVAGHECGHIKSGHVIYHTMGELFNSAISQIPVVSSFTTPIYYALMYWIRMSEFTADRAGLLACQDIDAAISGIIKMSGLPIKYFENMNKDAFIKQATEFKQSFSGFTDKAIKTLTIAGSSHPWTVLRAAELLTWYESGEYQDILNANTSSECSACHMQIPAGVKKCPYCGNEEEIKSES